MSSNTSFPQTWAVEFADAFVPEFRRLPKAVRLELLAQAVRLRQFGPELGRPTVDKGSRHANMKELRFKALDGGWCVAFAFDSRRSAILLVAGDKSGVSERRFYRALTAKADARLDAHLGRHAGNREN